MSNAPIGTTNDETVSARGGAAVTKSDATILSTTRALYIGGVGDVAVTFVDGTTATFTAVPGGTILPVEVTQVLSTGTSATSIVALR